MREHWTLDQYVDELLEVARMEFDQSVDSYILNLKYQMLKREMGERFTPEEMLNHGIVFENMR